MQLNQIEVQLVRLGDEKGRLLGLKEELMAAFVKKPVEEIVQPG